MANSSANSIRSRDARRYRFVMKPSQLQAPFIARDTLRRMKARSQPARAAAPHARPPASGDS